MSRRRSRSCRPAVPPSREAAEARSLSRAALLPLGALAAGFSSLALAQPAEPAPQTTTLPQVTVKGSAEPQGKQGYQTVTTTIGKGKQELRDIPQSVTVVSEKLIDDRNIDTLKEALHNTAGITFMAAEGGEEDIRLRGFSLQQSGDIFVDGMREPAFYERDTFNYDRLELLRGSASMLFGRGSTGGAANQVNKLPHLMSEHEVSATVGNHDYRRVTGDFNFKTGEESALRLNVMHTKASNNGSGSSIEKAGAAGSFRWGIGSADEFLVSLYHLDNNNGMNYGLPWIKPKALNAAGQPMPASTNRLLPGLDPSKYYGLSSDYNNGSASYATFSHLHRFGGETELRTMLRKGRFKRDQRASSIRFAGTAVQGTNTFTNPAAVDLSNFGPSTVLNRGTNLKVQDMDVLYAQSDFSSKFQALGVKHELLAGVDVAREEKTVYTAVGVPDPALTKGQIRVDGTPLGSNWVDEDLRTLTPGNAFEARNWGVYLQDLVQVAPHWKVLGGLRYDSLKGDYDQIVSTNPASPVGRTQQKISEWSKRFGVLYQPTPLHSFHFSYGTSFNTSGDTYSYAVGGGVDPKKLANTDPESSQNIELGAKIDAADGRFTTRLALFHSTKKNERNTDQTSVSGDSYLLSGKRHSAGFEIDITGRLTPKWEVYGSYMWVPIAKVDESASATFGNREGDRPGLTPKHSGTIWTTYQVLPKLRLGGGINFRSRQAPADITVPAGSNAADAKWEAPGYATFDLMGEYAFNETFTLKVNVNNAGNKYYSDSLYRGHYVPGAGRIIQASLSAKF